MGELLNPSTLGTTLLGNSRNQRNLQRIERIKQIQKPLIVPSPSESAQSAESAVTFLDWRAKPLGSLNP